MFFLGWSKYFLFSAYPNFEKDDFLISEKIHLLAKNETFLVNFKQCDFGE